ncbi:MAG: glutamyl-tRNA reductase [Actinomycetaceae bacterium]|nr:glutamyl-tRNA reductase [Actinomycetaceae bacterium]
MALISYSVHHREHGLTHVEQAAANVQGLASQLVGLPDMAGALVLSTCNRVEVLIDVATDNPNATTFFTSYIGYMLWCGDAAQTMAGEQHFISEDEVLGHREPQFKFPMRVRHGSEVIHHFFNIAAGLDSMVVGEREISGQLRRALQVATNQKTASATITRICEHALHTSRRVAQLTGLASQGRSVVNIGMEAVAQARYLDHHTLALIIGTGSYAGAAVAALRARGIQNIQVYSQSGRAKVFAAGHDLHPVDDLAEALRINDIVITCSGKGDCIIDHQVAYTARNQRDSDMIILDLALSKDVDPLVARMPGVYVIDLDMIQQRVPQAQREQVQRAYQIVGEGVTEAIDTIRSRRMDPVVIAMRETINAVVDEEIQKLPQSPTMSRADAEQALRRMARRLAHTPSEKAREAGQMGRAEEFIDAVEQVLGLELELPGCSGAASSKRKIGCPGETGLPPDIEFSDSINDEVTTILHNVDISPQFTKEQEAV